MDENLVGYLLNSLDPGTHLQVEAYLEEHPEARHRLELLRQALAPLAADAEEEPPPGLAVRTLGHIARHQARRPEATQARRPAPAPRPAYRNLPPAPRPFPSAGTEVVRSWWRRADVLVAALVLFAALGLGVSLLPGMWQRQQILACQNNLRLFQQALADYSGRHDHQFPKVEAEPPRNVAGIFVPILRDAGALPGTVSVSCPANGDRQPPALSVADLEELQRTRPAEFRAQVQRLAGCYAYCLGYTDDGVLCGLRDDDEDALPIVADRPVFAAGRVREGNSANHGGLGQNVLYVDGHVRFCTSRTAGVGGDDIYINQRGQVGAGRNRLDSVLGASAATPYPPEE
jgi:prepilin-type processing-associated H-X9-DG protein